MKPLLTVFTPTYNRKHTLIRTYESLKKQSNKGFIWLIVDDGSTDATNILVEEWKKRDNGFEIKYIYKENGGMHTAHNVAYKVIETELNVCIDSDDAMPENAVEIIYKVWQNIEDKSNIAGIIGLDADFKGNVLGTKFIQEGIKTTLYGFYESGGKGDKKLVYRTDVMRRYPPYPEYEGEKLVPLSYKYYLCDFDYKLYATNEVICFVEYQIDGSTNNMWRQRVLNARGFAFYKKVRMEKPRKMKQLFLDTIHYIASSIIINDHNFIKDSPKKFLTVALFPIGKVVSIIIKRRSGLFDK